MTRQLAAASLGAGALTAEELDEYRRQRPYIFPETITTDRGSVFVSDAFQAACARLGISLNTSAPYTPTDKARVERMFGTINDQFTQFLDGYVGRSPEYRGKDAASWPTLAATQLQALVDEWVLVHWQNRAHSGLRDPLFPSRKLTPNEMARAWRHVAPELPVPFDAETYISLMPTKWCAIGAGGIQIGNRTYDSAELRPLRRMDSPHTAHRGKWPVHCDPHNVQTVWLELDGGLLPLAWKSAQFLGPLSDDVWAATREPGFLNRSPDAEARRIKHAAQIIAKGANPGRQVKKDLARQAGVHRDPAQLHLEASIHPVPALEPAAAKPERGPELDEEPAAAPAVTTGFGLLEDTDWEKA